MQSKKWNWRVVTNARFLLFNSFEAVKNVRKIAFYNRLILYVKLIKTVFERNIFPHSVITIGQLSHIERAIHIRRLLSGLYSHKFHVLLSRNVRKFHSTWWNSMEDLASFFRRERMLSRWINKRDLQIMLRIVVVLCKVGIQRNNDVAEFFVCHMRSQLLLSGAHLYI